MAALTVTVNDPNIVVLGLNKPAVTLGDTSTSALFVSGAYLTFDVTGTGCVMGVDSGLDPAAHIELTVDGVTTNPTKGSPADPATFPLFGGLSDATRTVTIRNDGSTIFVKVGILFAATGSAPAFAIPAGFGLPQYFYGHGDHIEVDPGLSEAVVSFIPMVAGPVENASIAFYAKCDTLRFYHQRFGNTFALWIDDAFDRTIGPRTSDFAFELMDVTGLDATAHHKYRLIPIDTPGNVLMQAVMAVGGTGIRATPAMPARVSVVFGFDSICKGHGATADSRQSFGYKLQTLHNIACATNGVNGRALTGYADSADDYFLALNPMPNFVSDGVWGTGEMAGSSGDDSTTLGIMTTFAGNVAAGLPAGTVFYAFGTLYRTGTARGRTDQFNTDVRQAGTVAAASANAVYLPTSGWGFDETVDVDTGDGLHPNDAGNALLATKFAAVFDPIIPTLTLTGPTTGSVGVASTAFTVTLNVAANGTDSFSLYDTAQGGTWAVTVTGGVTDLGDGSVAVVPAAGQTSFTATYAAATAGVKTLGITTAADWTLPDEITFTASDATPPTAPSNLQVSLNLDGVSVDVGWNASPEDDVAGYRVYRATSLGGTYALVGSTNLFTISYNDATVSAGHTYWYKVSAVDAVPNESARTAAMSVSVPAARGGGGGGTFGLGLGLGL